MRLNTQRRCWFRLVQWMTPLGLLMLFATQTGFLLQTGWTPLPVRDDPLVRMPGTQPGQGVKLESPDRCQNCHSGYDPVAEPWTMWQGSMMAQSARDPLFWACLTVAIQDSIWAIGRPNGADICLRCHMPQGWIEGRSDPVNASLMTRSDFDGVHCDVCHRMWNPFFEATHTGEREGSDWRGYWDEATSASQTAANTTLQADRTQAQTIRLFNGGNFFVNNRPFSSEYDENAAGQYFIDSNNRKRGPFADAEARHQMFYSRYHKSKYFCSTCHDVSNPVLANLAYANARPGDNVVLPTEQKPAHSYYHVERTFSEFILSAYGQEGGAPGIGPFAPDRFRTSQPGNRIAMCQDCHMADVPGKGCDMRNAPNRPSREHPKSGVPTHDLTGGNIWVPWLLASAVRGSPNYDAVNARLLGQGPNVLTLDLRQGLGLNPSALLNAVERAKNMLRAAASIQHLEYDPQTGALRFRVQNQTGHKLISGFPEGRRMFLNIKVYRGGTLIHEVNPYDYNVGTLKGLSQAYSPNSPLLAAHEVYIDALVYEAQMSSSLTGEQKTFHFVLADRRYKDNRIPPKGFRIEAATARLAEPVWEGFSRPDYFTPEEYAGGYDEVSLQVPAGADRVEVNLYYQVTSREYMEFLRDEINGTGRLTLPARAYIAQTDPFFARLRAWGDTIWQLWERNKNVPGAAPFLMTQGVWTR
ncbi:MAG: cytochrome c family protein [Fimbriimonadales bacterium]|nr:cytochrome c family protein [Fimbriimonadales bacterium]